MNRALLMATEDSARVDATLHTSEGVAFHPAITLHDVKSLLGDGSAIYVCPTEWVSFIDIDLPSVKSSLLKVVLPNLVEEQLAESIEQVHCAVPAVRITAGKTPVAIIRRDRIDNVIKTFQAADIHLEAMFPTLYVLPVVDHGWSCWKKEDQLIVRQDVYHGFALHASEMDTWFKEMQKPEHIVYQTADAIQAGIQALFSTSAPINLLQGDFATKGKKKNIDLFKTALIAFGGSVVFYFIYLIASNAILATRLEQLQSQTLALYQQAFPGATQATSPRVLLTRELQKRGQSQQRFFVLMSALTQGLARDKSVELTHVQFTGDRVTATIIAKDFASLESLPAYFKANNIVFKQENASQVENHVEARIQLEVAS